MCVTVKEKRYCWVSNRDWVSVCVRLCVYTWARERESSIGFTDIPLSFFLSFLFSSLTVTLALKQGHLVSFCDAASFLLSVYKNRTHMHTHAHGHGHPPTKTHTQTCQHTHPHTHMQTHTRTNTHTCQHTHTHAHTHTSTHSHTHTNAHTHILVFSPSLSVGSKGLWRSQLLKPRKDLDEPNKDSNFVGKVYSGPNLPHPRPHHTWPVRKM